MSLLKLSVDRQSGRLVPFNGTPTELPALFQYNVKPFRIQIVDPTNTLGPSTPYVPQNFNGYGLRLAITPTPTGTGGGPAVLALQTTWAWDNANLWFTGSIGLATAEISTYIGALEQKVANLEITLTTGGDRITVYQGPVTLRAVGDEGTASEPAPEDVYLPKSESDARYVRKQGSPGEVLVLISPNGLYGIELVCNDDGTLGQNSITL